MTPERWQRVEDLYHAAVARERASEREAFLSEACGTDHELRSEIESLLAQDTSQGVFQRRSVLLGDAQMPDSAQRPGVGSQLGPYRIESSIGKGGMGEVWKARDTRLNREVAVKISLQQFTHRFEQEARAVAALNHSNICTIHDVGLNYLVMELVEGPTLAERMRRGPVPLDEALRIAVQIASALEAAHSRGIVHRDLKPANIKIRPDGSVKVLDFGLAKRTESEPAFSLESATVAGTILGTAGYMAPEQARGEKVDKRADIWSFGVVLYEMVSGQRLFEGKSVSDTLAAVLTSEPDWERAPQRVQRLLHKCLEKDPRRRLRDISGVELLLDEPARPEPKRFAKGIWMAVPAMFALLAVAAALIHFRETPAKAPVVRFTFAPPGDAFLRLNSGVPYPIAVSPDGRRIVFSGVSKGKAQLWMRSLDTLSAQPIPGTDDGLSPFWSPDSRYIGFGSGGKLKKIDVNGGPPITLAEAPHVSGGTWNSDDVIVFAPYAEGTLSRVAASGGAVIPATMPDQSAEGNISHHWPQFLPDGRHFLFASSNVFRGGREPVTIRLGSLDSQESKSLLQVNSNAIYAEGHLLFLSNSTLMVQSFDLKALTVTGDAHPIVEPVESRAVAHNGIFSASANGVLAYSRGEPEARLIWFDRQGRILSTVGDPEPLGEISLSPDQKSVAFNSQGQNADVWIYDLLRGVRSRFTFDPALELSAVWSPEGRSIIFNSSRKGPLDLYRKASDGTGAEQLLYADKLDKYPTAWSPDGRLLCFTAVDPKTGLDIWILDLTAQGSAPKAHPWLKTPFGEANAQFSPDGRWVAYQSWESGRLEIYVAPFSGPGGRRRVSTGGGVYPRWRHDGREIFYIGDSYVGNSERKIMAVEASVKGGMIDTGEPHPLFGPVITGQGYLYDVSADGQRFLAVVPSEQTHELTVVQNWTAGLTK